MHAITPLAEKACIPPNFSLEEYASSGAMEFGRGKAITLTAWVSPGLGALLQETPLNTTQSIEPKKDGYCLTAELHDSWQLVWWVLSQAENIRVRSPQVFKKRIDNHIAVMVDGSQIF